MRELIYSCHVEDIVIIACSRACMQSKEIMLAGERLGITEVHDRAWLVSFMHYDLGYLDLDQRTLQTIDKPFGTRLSPMS